jgi:hypothetical protein
VSLKKIWPANKTITKKKKEAMNTATTSAPSSSLATKTKQQPLSCTTANTTGSNSSGKKVSFHTVLVYKVLSRNDYTPFEKAATWFTGDEFSSIRSSALSLAKSMDSLVGIHKTRMVHAEGRGLERVMKHNLKKHTTRRKTLFREIALLQRDEFRHVTADDVALLFQSYTHASQLEARSMGRDDEVRARDCYSGDEEFMKVFFQLFGGNAMLCTSTAKSSSSLPLPPSSLVAAAPSSSRTSEIRNLTDGKISQGDNSQNSNRNLRRKIVSNTAGSKGMEVKRKFRDEISSRLVAARSIR